MQDALSDERTGLQFAVQSLNGPSRAEPVTILYSHLRFSQPEGPGSRICIPQEQGAPITLPGIGLPFFASYDSQGYSGGILTRLHTGIITLFTLQLIFDVYKFLST
jgi:hypothetical protein